MNKYIYNGSGSIVLQGVGEIVAGTPFETEIEINHPLISEYKELPKFNKKEKIKVINSK